MADARGELDAVREQIRQRQARLGARFGADGGAEGGRSLVRESVQAVNDLAMVSAHLPITWQTRVVGRAGAYFKRATRVLLRWYVNPIVEQQNRYNAAVARALVEIAAYQERLTREWQLLEERAIALEARLDSAPREEP